MSLVIGIILKATALLLLAAIAEAVIRKRGSAAARHLIWTFAILGTLVLPALSLTLPQLEVAVPVSIARGADHATTIPAEVQSNDTEAQFETNASPSGGASASTSISTASVIVMLYFSGVAVLLLRIVFERIALRRLANRASPVDAPGWQPLVSDAARQLGIGRPIRLLASDEEVMPMTFGTVHPTVLLPTSAVDWTVDRREAVLRHELAHIARNDCLTQLLASIAGAIYWFHPGVWWAAHRLRVERELACDDRVLALGAEPDTYARDLLEIARTFGVTRAPATAIGMARRGQLEGRLLAVLDTARNRTTVRFRVAAFAAAAAAALLVPTAALRASLAPVDPRDETASEPLSFRTPEPQTPAPQNSQRSSFAGTWEIRAAREPGFVHLTLHDRNSSWGRSVEVLRLQGFSAADLARGGAQVHFTSPRDAGTFTFEGFCRSGICGGTYTFAPDPAFAAELARRGIGRPTEAQQYELAMGDVGMELVSELAAEKYKTPNLSAFIRGAQHGVTADFVRGMADLGYRLGTIEALITLRDHGVDPEFVRAMAAVGFSKLTADDLVRSRDHGVDADFASGMADRARRALTLDELIRARDHGVDPKFAADMASLGLTSLSLDSLVAARDHGVDPKFAREMADVGYRGLSMEVLIRLRDHGVDAGYVRQLRQRGVSNLSIDELIRRRDSGR